MVSALRGGEVRYASARSCPKCQHDTADRYPQIAHQLPSLIVERSMRQATYPFYWGMSEEQMNGDDGG